MTSINTSQLIIITFIVTALYDIIARLIAENKLHLLNLKNSDWIISLKPYFKKHTLLAAALIAGFVGAISQYIIIQFKDFPENYDLYFLTITSLVSGSFGLVMEHSKLFPHLVDTYYKKLGKPRSIITDTLSGLIVNITIITLFKTFDITID
jgi:hypothetical protein